MEMAENVLNDEQFGSVRAATSEKNIKFLKPEIAFIRFNHVYVNFEESGQFEHFPVRSFSANMVKN